MLQPVNSIQFPPPSPHQSGGKIENEMGGEACTGFWWENLKERDHLVDLGVDGMIILRWIFRKWDVTVMDWIELAQDRDRWRELVTAVMNLRGS